MEAFVRGMLRLLGDIVAPSRCSACDAEVKRGAAFCLPCVATLVRAPNLEARETAAFVYGGAIAEALKRFKFSDRPDLAPGLLAGLAPLLPRLRGQDIIVPVPLHPSRLVERGYNQAALLARPLAWTLAVPNGMHVLVRRFATARQTELSRVGRKRNVEGAFEVVDPRKIEGRRVLLVDDVETTGATLEGCRDALLARGAREVDTVVIARAESPPDPANTEAGGGYTPFA